MTDLTPDAVLERTQWDGFWLPPDVAAVERAELLYWVCPRDIAVLNTINRLRAPAEAIPGLVDEVVKAHAAVTSRWLVCPQNRSSELERTLDERGYRAVFSHRAYVTDVDRFEPKRRNDSIEVRRVTSVAELRDCWDVTRRAFGDERGPPDDETLALELAQCTGPEARVGRFVAYDRSSGAAMASAGVTWHHALSFGFLWAGGTAPEARGRGAYSALVAARIARLVGIERVGLYARLDTSAPIVAKQGFEGHGEMTYWDREPEDPSSSSG